MDFSYFYPKNHLNQLLNYLLAQRLYIFLKYHDPLGLGDLRSICISSPYTIQQFEAKKQVLVVLASLHGSIFIESFRNFLIICKLLPISISLVLSIHPVEPIFLQWPLLFCEPFNQPLPPCALDHQLAIILIQSWWYPRHIAGQGGQELNQTLHQLLVSSILQQPLCFINQRQRKNIFGIRISWFINVFLLLSNLQYSRSITDSIIETPREIVILSFVFIPNEDQLLARTIQLKLGVESSPILLILVGTQNNLNTTGLFPIEHSLEHECLLFPQKEIESS